MMRLPWSAMWHRDRQQSQATRLRPAAPRESGHG
jgi:hypothetical protein